MTFSNLNHTARLMGNLVTPCSGGKSKRNSRHQPSRPSTLGGQATPSASLRRPETPTPRQNQASNSSTATPHYCKNAANSRNKDPVSSDSKPHHKPPVLVIEVPRRRQPPQER